MAIPELIKFREKYPDYGDMDDATLASKLATKYPDAYGDLLEKVKPVEADTPGWKQTVSTYAKPVLETAGLVAGGVMGAVAGPPGAVGGAALGYGAGRQAGKLLDNFMLDTPTETPVQAVSNAGRDLATGAAMEMGGQALGVGISSLGRFIKPSKGSIPGTQANAQKKAAQIFNEAQAPPASAELSALQARQAAQADALMARKGLDPKLLTPAQRTGSFEAGYLEQGATTANPKFAAQLAERDAQIAAKARGDVTNVFQPNAPLAARSAQETGESIVSSVQKARTPVKAAENEAWANVSGSYQIDTPSTSGAFTEIQKTIIPPDIKSKVAGIQEFYSSVPKTVEGMRAVEADLNQQIRVASRAGETNTVRILSKIKDGIVKDFDDLSSAAGSGKLFEYDGKLVNPEIVAKEISANTKKINELSKLGERLEVKPRIQLDELVQRNNSLSEILNVMKPADDVAAQINAAKKATIERVERFDKGVTKSALAKGDEISGLRTTYESLPAKYFSQQGADDLIRAVGSQQAKNLMSEHVTANMEKLTKNGTLNVTSAIQFLEKNKTTLQKLKLTDTAKQTIAGQIPGAIRAKLDTRMAMDNFGNEVNTLHEVRKIVSEFAPAIRATYKDGGKKELLALNDYHKILEILGRNKNVSYSKGSNSIDKLMGAVYSAPEGSIGKKLVNALAESVSGAGLGFTLAGPIGGVTGAALGAGTKATRTVITEHQKNAIKAILEDGITNPETARLLTRLAKGYKPKPVEMNKVLGANGYEWTKTGLAVKAALPMMSNDE